MKYVVFDKVKFIIFPTTINHSDFKHLNPASAGFVKIIKVEENEWGDSHPVVYCYGESISLKLQSRGEKDEKILNVGVRI